jgi:hypothetical protein
MGNATGEIFDNEADLDISVCQSSQYPCMNNTVTVSISSSTPLYRRCQPQLTISGLKLSSTLSSNLATTYKVHNGPERSGLITTTWNQSLGSLTFDINDVLDSEGRTNLTQVIFEVVLRNPRLSQAAPALSASASLFYVEGVTWVEAVTTCDGDTKPFFIESLAWSTVDVTSSSSDPCSSNIVTVSLTPTIPLACVKCITLTGFTGSLTEDADPFALTSGGGVFSSAAWTQSGGVLELCVDPSTFMPRDQDIVLSFEIQNVNADKSALTSIDIDVSVDDEDEFLSEEVSVGLSFMNVDEPAWSQVALPSVPFPRTLSCEIPFPA